MKTITTVLPVYDKIAKQCFERGKDGGVDSPIAIKCPRHRLPSMLWNVENDNPGEISFIELIGLDGNAYIKSLYNDWISHGGWDTFIHSGLNITSAVNLAGSEIADIALNGAYEVAVTQGDIVTVRGTLDYTGVAPHLVFRQDDVDIQNSTMANGEYSVTFTVTANSDLSIALTAGVTNFTFLNAEVGIANINDTFNTTAAYIQNGGGAGWTNTGYDVFTSVLRDITSAIKTTAAGEAYCLNAIAVGSVPAGITIGETIRIKAVLTLNSGTAPKIVLRRTDTNAAISNIVTLANGTNYISLTATQTMAGTWGIVIYNSTTELSNWSCELTQGQKTAMPTLYTTLTDDYFQYKGDTLGLLLPFGTWYLKITTAGGYIYYSDWFDVVCIYENLLSSLVNVNYNTFTISGTAITSAIETGADGVARSPEIFPVIIGEMIKVITSLTLNGGALPWVTLHDKVTGAGLSNAFQLAIGLNVIELTVLVASDNAVLQVYQSGTFPVNYSTSEIILIREYSEKYLTINFLNTCDLGDIVYQNGFLQTAWIESEPMEMSFPQEEKGVENGEARFIRTFARQVKKYTVKTLELPDYMAEVFHRMKLHDTVELIDLVGDVNDIYNLEVEHEWLWDDKYYCKVELTFDFDEAFVIGGCCNNII